MNMRDIWIPHIPKNAGKTVILNIKEHCQNNKNFNHEFVEDLYYNAKNYNTERRIRLDHGTVYESEKKNWLNILVIRNPLDRFVSWFNWSKWLSWMHNKAINDLSMDQFIELGCGNNTIIKNPHGPWFASHHIGHLQFLNMQQAIYGCDKDQKKKFTLKNVFNIFDHIIDVSNIDKVFALIEDNFLNKKINWKRYNTDQQTIDRLNQLQIPEEFKLFHKESLNEKQIERINDVSGFNEDKIFYEKWKTLCRH